MTLEEAIIHAEAVAKTKEREAKKNRNHGGRAYDDEAKKCSDCAAEHRQLAEWLRELKRLREQELCEDAVSRQLVCDMIIKKYDDCGDGNMVGYYDVLLDGVMRMPSVTPERKKGKWTKDCACEICGFKPWYERDIHTLSFCPNCGADMREDNNG